MKLPYQRYVRQVQTAPSPKSSYLALMALNAEAIKAAEWREVADASSSLVPHDFARASFLDPAYDAYIMAGAYDVSAQTLAAFAGQAAYRYKLPSAYTASGATATLQSISLRVARDRFLRSGLRIVAQLSDDASPSADWATIRGEGSGCTPSQSPVLDQSDAANLVSTSAADDTIEISLSTAPRAAYLWVYISLEDYEDRWEMYSERERRQYAIEGSGMIAGALAEIEFAGGVAPDAAPDADPGTRLVTSGWPGGNFRIGNFDLTSNLVLLRAFAANAATSAGALAGRALFLAASGVVSPLRIFYGGSVYEFGLAAEGLDDDAVRQSASLRAFGSCFGVTDALMANISTDNWDLYIATRDATYRVGRVQLANGTYTLHPELGAKTVGRGGDLLLAYYSGTFNGDKVWTVLAASYGGGTLTIGDTSMPYEGEITGLGHYDGPDSGKFIVAGRLRAVNGVPCSTYGIVTAGGSTGIVDFAPGHGQSAFEPNFYGNFRVVRARPSGAATPIFYALGDYTQLGGRARPYGVAQLTGSDAQGYDNSAVVADLGTSAEKHITDIANLTTDSSVSYIYATRTAVPL